MCSWGWARCRRRGRSRKRRRRRRRTRHSPRRRCTRPRSVHTIPVLLAEIATGRIRFLLLQRRIPPEQVCLRDFPEGTGRLAVADARVVVLKIATIDEASAILQCAWGDGERVRVTYGV